MTERRTGLERFWSGCDSLLLIIVVCLTGVWFYSSRQAGTRLLATEPESEVPAAKGLRNLPSAGRAVEGMRVSLERDRMNSIARSMVETAWERIPSSPAIDMRENGKSYEILFALPEEVDAEHVRVSAQGNILTLAMTSQDTGTILMQRFRIPCGVERDENIDTAVSNNVLRVRIHPVASH